MAAKVSSRFPALDGEIMSLIARSGHLQTMYSVVGNFLKVDKIKYRR